MGETVEVCKNHCIDHKHQVEISMDLKAHKEECAENLHDLKNNVIRLTENLDSVKENLKGVKEILAELKAYNIVQDKEIKENSKFVYKAVGVIGSLSVIAAMATPILWLLKQMLEKQP